MSDRLDKAKAALDAAKELDDINGANAREYTDLLIIARVQAEIAQAEALERIADKMAYVTNFVR